MIAALFLLSLVSQPLVQLPARQDTDPQTIIASIFNDLGVKDFRFRKTRHFVIGYDTSDEFIRPHVGRLEGIHGAVSRFCEANGFKTGAAARGASADESAESPLLAKEGVRGRSAETADLLPIIFFDKFETFSRYAQKMEMPSEGIAGFYHQSNNVAAFVNAADLPAIRAVNDQLQSTHKQLLEARAGAKDAAGRANASAIENTIYTVSAQRDSIVEAFNRFVLQHEAAHQILFNAGVHPRGAVSPQWLVEGLACQFEVPQPDPSGRRLAVNQMRLADLREIIGVRPGQTTGASRRSAAAEILSRTPAETVPPGRGDHRGVEREEGDKANGQPTARGSKEDAEVVRTSKLIPLRQLVSGDDVFSGDRLKAAYAQSWGLVLYLHRTSPDAFREYLHKLAQREIGRQPDPKTDLAEIESIFGPIDGKFEQSWADFVARLPVEP